MKGNFDYTIGSSAKADIRLVHEGISSQHAVFRRRGDRLFIKPLGRESAIFLNGSLVRHSRFQEFTRYDVLRLGNLAVELSSDLFMGRQRLGLRATPLFYYGHNGRLLTNGIEFVAQPGTVTAIMGPSGCGKSILVKLLAGILSPSKGEVFLINKDGTHPSNGRYSGNSVGYVPQGDAMFSELTTRMSLDFRLKLLFPDMRKGVRWRLIEQSAARIGFRGIRRNQFLETAIGSTDSSGAYLSGGERRRANLCHELVSQPLVLILDEPTSGLSSHDADDVMNLLKRLAVEEGMTIITTIHQPGEKAFKTIDQLILLSYGGFVAYRGEAHNAAERISLKTGLPQSGKTHSEYIVEAHELLAKNPETDDSLPHPTQNHQVAEENLIKERRFRNIAHLARHLFTWSSQFFRLLSRQLILMAKDKGSIGFSLLQVPILFLLVFITYHGSDSDYADADHLVRMQHVYERLEKEQPGSRTNMIQRAYWISQRKEAVISVGHARHKASFAYLVTLIAIWFGLLSSCCDIVVNREVIAREFRSGVSLLHTILSQFVGNSILALTQAFAVASLALWSLSEISMVQPFFLFKAVFLATTTAVAIGLLISSLGNSARAALALVPVCLIPQILLGGLFRPLAGNSHIYTFLANLNPQRWAFNIALKNSQFAESGIIEPEVGVLQIGPSYGNYSTVKDLLNFTETGVLDLYFPINRSMNMITPAGALLSIAAFSLLCSYLITLYSFRK